jgi:hypothetical protein
MGFLVHTLARRQGNTLFGFIIRETDQAVYNNVNGEFIEQVQLHLVLDELSRSKFRVPYVETRSGSYRLEVDCSDFLDDNYTIQSRFLSEGQESLPTDGVTVTAQAGDIQDSSLNMAISSRANLNLFCFIKDKFTDNYLKANSDDFVPMSLMDESEDLRAEFRHSLNEVAPGEYKLDRDLSVVPDTVLTVTIYQLLNGIEYKAGLPITAHVHDGRQQRGVLFDTVMVNHDIQEFDYLRYLAPNGDPIDSAEVYLFKKSEYASDKFDNALGRTLTRADGRWQEAIPAQAGDTYTVVLFKQGEFGPDTIDIVI